MAETKEIPKGHSTSLEIGFLSSRFTSGEDSDPTSENLQKGIP